MNTQREYEKYKQTQTQNLISHCRDLSNYIQDPLLRILAFQGSEDWCDGVQLRGGRALSFQCKQLPLARLRVLPTEIISNAHHVAKPDETTVNRFRLINLKA